MTRHRNVTVPYAEVVSLMLHLRLRYSRVLLAALTLALLAFVAIVPASQAATSFSTTTAWTWVYQNMGATPSTSQAVQASVSGVTTAHRNAGLVLRQSSSTRFAVANFSGTKYQVFLVNGTTMTKVYEKAFTITAPGVARAEVSGTSIKATWNGAVVATATVADLAGYTGTGTGLAIWQDAPSVVKLTNASYAALGAPAPAPSPTSTTSPTPTTTPTTAPTAVSFSTATAWTWAYRTMGSTVSTAQTVQATVSGVTSADRNAGLVLRRANDSQFAVANFSGTKFQVFLVEGSTMSLVHEAPLSTTGAGTVRADVSGTTVTGWRDGSVVATANVPALSRFTGTGTGLAIWQDVPSSVKLTNATYGSAGSTPTPVPPTTTTPTATPTTTTPPAPTPTPTPTPTATSTPTGTTGSAPMAYPTKAVALYHMMWSNSGSPALSTTPANVNVVNLAFAQGDPPSLVGWASDGQAKFVSSASALRARGVRIVLSVGGADGHVNIANRQGFVNGVMGINSLVPLDGLDWDLEGTAMGQADVLWISAELKRLRGPNFAITLAPNGSNIGEYLPIAKALHDAGNLTRIGQQFYDAVVSKEAAMGRIDQAVAAGIPVSKYSIGMMVGSTDHYWTVDECIANANYIKAKYPTIGGAYLWEAGRAGTADWANRVGPLFR